MILITTHVLATTTYKTEPRLVPVSFFVTPITRRGMKGILCRWSTYPPIYLVFLAPRNTIILLSQKDSSAAQNTIPV